MSTGRKNSRLELTVIAVFIVLAFIWAISNYNSRRAEIRRKMEAEAMEERRQDSLDRAAAMARMLPPKDTTPAAAAPAAPQVIKEQVTPLYVVLDELNMRSEPKLNSRLVARLKLYDEVVYLNEITEFKQEINLGGVTYNEPWIKIKNKRGQVGWVYGAGVHYYRLRREG